jgi:hypothetical protein
MPYKLLGLLIILCLLTGCAWFVSGEKQYRTEIVWKAPNYQGTYMPEGLRYGAVTLQDGRTSLWKEITAVKKHRADLELILKASRAKNWTIDPKAAIKYKRTGKDTVRITIPVVYHPTVIVLCDNVEGSFDLKTVYQDIVTLQQHGYPVFLYMTNGESPVSSFDDDTAWSGMNTQSPTYLVNRVFDAYNSFVDQFAVPSYLAPEDAYYLHVLMSSRVYASYKDRIAPFAAKLAQKGRFQTVFYVPVNDYDNTKPAASVDLRFVDPKTPGILDTSALR